MKLLKMKFKVLMVVILLAMACQPENDFPELSTLSLKTELLEGTWTVRKVVQVDKEALDNGFPEEVQQRDITTLFPFTEYQVTFNLEANGRPGTFLVDAGDSPNFLSLNSGIWQLDDYVFTTIISLTSPSDLNASSFRVKRLEQNVIVIQVVRNDFADNTEYSYYEYELVK